MRVVGWFLAGGLVAACGGNDEGGTSQPGGGSSQGGSSTQAGSQGMTVAGTGGGGNGSMTPMTKAEVCSDSCAKQGECGGDEASCLANCNAVDRVFDANCVTKQLAEFACVADLSCDELTSYANDKSASSLCGATYQDFATSCTLNAGVPPKACQDFCAKSLLCSPGGKQQAGCAQVCNEVLTGYDIAGGSDCSAVMEAAFGCFATLECAVLTPALASGVTPAACSQYDAQLTSACR